MNFIFLCLLGSLLECYYCVTVCRDPDTKPVAWWYVYKPPAGVLGPKGDSIIILTPDTNRWVQSEQTIIDRNLITITLMPKPNETLQPGLALVNLAPRAPKGGILKYDIVALGRSGHPGRPTLTLFSHWLIILAHLRRPPPTLNSAHLTALLPYIPLEASVPLFPSEELPNGHLFSCISLNFNGLNKAGRALKEIRPNFMYLSLPTPFADRLPMWDFTNTHPQSRQRPSIYTLVNAKKSPVSEKSGPLDVVLIARPPGVKDSVYSTFATRQMVMLNVYGQSRSNYVTTVCGDGFGVRNIQSISLKFKNLDTSIVAYVPLNSTDYTWFAVSTAAHWQQLGKGGAEYWTCTSLLDKDDNSGEGGLLLCVHNYKVWSAFDNLKDSEPICV